MARRTGCYKLAANYAGATQPAMEALKEGYHQVLWLFGPDRQLTEVGAMNSLSSSATSRPTARPPTTRSPPPRSMTAPSCPV